MIINAVGCPYSGTEVLTILLNEFGVRTRNSGPDLIHDRRLVSRRIPYDLKKIPSWIHEWMAKYEMNGLNDYMKLDEHFLHDEWGRVCAMYALSKSYPKLKFLIMLRDPKLIIGQWFGTEGTTGPEITIETYRNAVEKIYHFMFQQAELMQDKPIVMDYEKFEKGEYLQHIFKMFGIERSMKNIHIGQGIISGNRMKKYEEYQGNVSTINFFGNNLMKWEI